MSLAIVYQRSPDERTRAVIEKAQGAARRMETFIHELLPFARRGPSLAQERRRGSRRCCANVEQDLAPGAAQKEVTVIVDASVHPLRRIKLKHHAPRLRSGSRPPPRSWASVLEGAR